MHKGTEKLHSKRVEKIENALKKGEKDANKDGKEFFRYTQKLGVKRVNYDFLFCSRNTTLVSLFHSFQVEKQVKKILTKLLKLLKVPTSPLKPQSACHQGSRLPSA